MSDTDLKKCATILLSVLIVIGGCSKSDNNDNNYYGGSSEDDIEVSDDSVDKKENGTGEVGTDNSNKVLTDTSLTEFNRFASKFEGSDIPYEAKVGKIHDINRREKMDSIHVEKFLSEGIAFEEFGKDMLYLPPPYGDRLDFPGDFIALVYPYSMAPEMRLYLSTFSDDGEMIDEEEIARKTDRGSAVLESRIKKDGSIVLIKEEYRGKDRVRTDTSRMFVNPSGEIVQEGS